jgi:hypothetical protein
MAARKTTRESIGGAVAGHAAGWAPRRRPSGDCAVYNSGSMPARRSLARGLARCSCAPATLRLGDVRLRIGLRALSARRVPVHSISEGPENYSRFLWPQVEKGRVAAGSSERRGGGLARLVHGTFPNLTLERAQDARTDRVFAREGPIRRAGVTDRCTESRR